MNTLNNNSSIFSLINAVWGAVIWMSIFWDYIVVKDKHAVYVQHTPARYAVKKFRKAQCQILGRLTNYLMMHGRNNGKKLMTVRIVRHAFEMIHLLTGEVRISTPPICPTLKEN